MQLWKSGWLWGLVAGETKRRPIPRGPVYKSLGLETLEDRIAPAVNLSLLPPAIVHPTDAVEQIPGQNRFEVPLSSFAAFVSNQPKPPANVVIVDSAVANYDEPALKASAFSCL